MVARALIVIGNSVDVLGIPLRVVDRELVGRTGEVCRCAIDHVELSRVGALKSRAGD